MAGVYIHIPYCRQACHYCDFHFSTRTSSAQNMVQSIVRESQLRAHSEPAWRNHNIDTLYIGGGTPSLLDERLILDLVEGVAGALNLDVHQLKEVTMEANPEDLEEPKLEAWLKAGINRLSIGIQSFDDDTLTWMNRAHTGREAERGVQQAQRAGFSNITVDLIYGVPTDRNWTRDVDTALSLPIQHLSAYALTVEPRTVLGTRVAKGQQAPLSDERAVSEYLHLCDVMAKLGWTHYETSNWAAPQNDGWWTARHNASYWSGRPYLGLGPGAHGFVSPTRYANVANNPKYLSALYESRLAFTEEHLTSVDRYNEQLMTGLRTANGIHLEVLERQFGMRPDMLEPAAWEAAIHQGSLVPTPDGGHRIPEEQWITGDQVAASFFQVS